MTKEPVAFLKPDPDPFKRIAGIIQFHALVKSKLDPDHEFQEVSDKEIQDWLVEDDLDPTDEAVAKVRELAYSGTWSADIIDASPQLNQRD